MDGDGDTTTESLTSVFRGSSLFAVGFVVSYAFGFLTQLLLTRLLGAASYGMFSYARTLLELGGKLSNLGTDKSLMRYLPAQSDDPAAQRSTVTLAYATSTAAGLVIAALAILLAPTISAFTIDSPAFVAVVRLFAVILVFDTVLKIVSSTFRALGVAKFDVLLYRIGRPGAMLVAAVLAFALGLQLFETVVVIVVGSAFTVGFALWLAARELSVTPSGSVSGIDLRSYYNYSIPLASKDLGSYFYTRADILMVGLFFPSSTVGVYTIAVLLTSVITLPRGGVNQLFPPIASKLRSSGQHDELAEVYAAVSRWAMSGALPLAIGAIVYRDELLSLFGTEFVAGGAILAVLAVAKFVDAAVGPSGYLLMMADHQYLLLANQWTFAAVNVVLNYVFILEFGVIGAAYASAIVLGGINATRVLQVWYFEAMHPFSVALVKPLLAGVPAAATMLVAPAFSPLSPVVTMFLAGAGGCLVYLGALYAIGVEDADRRVYDSIVGE